MPSRFPTVVANIGGGGAGVVAPSQNLGLSQNMGGAWGSIKRCQKIPVKEFI